MLQDKLTVLQDMAAQRVMNVKLVTQHKKLRKNTPTTIWGDCAVHVHHKSLGLEVIEGGYS